MDALCTCIYRFANNIVSFLIYSSPFRVCSDLSLNDPINPQSPAKNNPWVHSICSFNVCCVVGDYSSHISFLRSDKAT